MVPKSNVAQLRNSLASGDIAAVQPGELAKVSAAGNSYKVRKGDTLSGIASKLGVSVSALKQQNNLRSASVRIGQTRPLAAKLARRSWRITATASPTVYVRVILCQYRQTSRC